MTKNVYFSLFAHTFCNFLNMTFGHMTSGIESVTDECKEGRSDVRVEIVRYILYMKQYMSALILLTL